MKLEANVDLYSITYAAFIHRDNNQRIEGSGKVDLIEIDGWSQFFSVVYDNRSDLLLDFEWQVEQYSFENSHRKIEYTTNTFRTGIEYRFTKDMFLIHEHSIRLINDSGRPWVGQTYSLLWDKTPYTPYIGYTDTKYDYIHSNELTIGSGYAFENGLNVRINYKYVR